MVCRNLLRRKARTALTVAAVALSIGATVALLGISTGLVRQVAAVVSEAGSELTVVQRIPKGLTFGYVGTLPEAMVAELAATEGIARVGPVLFIPGALTRDVIFLIYGVEPGGLELRRARLLVGRTLREDDGSAVLLGARAAEGMGKGVGDSLEIAGKTLPIVGIYRTGVNLEDGGAMMSLRGAQETFGALGRVSLIKVKAADRARVEALRAAIERRYPEASVLTSEEFAADRLNLEAAVQAGWAVSLIAVLLSVFAVANTMAMSVLERAREIGILKAVGWGRGRIVLLFFGESLAQSAAGGLAGVGLGLAALRLLSKTYLTLPLPTAASPALLAGALALALAVGAVGGLLPSWRAARLDPVQAIRQL
ncbi:MAG: FtsX-like permease family protein [Armatimonadota bacterium]|nr:FtsX-like permease family protein [Armatimonadota bacterium]MDR7467924.1 FtsX-like permease family protein [Armatimonadota bacterium]MDR7494223.1 FtsX-like permease family protein [Armatimonadota bacterium]MDR7547827.1 FtsX-like permease family protein [Armatimonadota bacterium]MDR7553611.1 FtsX-like permease family protein [Armatimonadota bacterium]